MGRYGTVFTFLAFRSTFRTLFTVIDGMINMSGPLSLSLYCSICYSPVDHRSDLTQIGTFTFICRECGPCQCGDLMCGRPIVRTRNFNLLSAYTAIPGARYGFGSEQQSKLVALIHRACFTCGEWCLHQDHPETARPYPSKVCAACGTCIHGYDYRQLQCIIDGQVEYKLVHATCAQCTYCYNTRKESEPDIVLIQSKRTGAFKVRCKWCIRCDLCESYGMSRNKGALQMEDDVGYVWGHYRCYTMFRRRMMELYEDFNETKDRIAHRILKKRIDTFNSIWYNPDIAWPTCDQCYVTSQ